MIDKEHIRKIRAQWKLEGSNEDYLFIIPWDYSDIRQETLDFCTRELKEDGVLSETGSVTKPARVKIRWETGSGHGMYFDVVLWPSEWARVISKTDNMLSLFKVADWKDLAKSLEEFYYSSADVAPLGLTKTPWEIVS